MNIPFISSIVAIAGVAVSACTGAAAGTRPDDMSVAGHEAAAVQWRSSMPSNSQNAEQLRKARAVAAQHHVAAQALVDAEARACNGVAVADRDISPFSRKQDIEGASALYMEGIGSSENPAAKELVGAAVTFRAVPGLTGEWFQRIVDCHLARNASLGHPVDAMPDCPLVLKNVSAVVKSAGPGFVVEVSSDDPAVAREILGRAQRDASSSAQR